MNGFVILAVYAVIMLAATFLFARSVHLLEPMKAIVKELLDSGKSVEEISKELGMRPEEVFRLSDFSREDFLNMMVAGNTSYSPAEYITRI